MGPTIETTKLFNFQFVFIEQEIIDALADTAENNTFLKRDIVFAHLNFILDTVKFRLCSANVHATGKLVVKFFYN